MSDCSTNAFRKPVWEGVEWHEPQPAMRLRAEFDHGNPWKYDIALNGRRLLKLTVNGVRYVPEDFGFEYVMRNGRIVAIVHEGVRYVPAPAYEEGCEVVD